MTAAAILVGLASLGMLMWRWPWPLDATLALAAAASWSVHQGDHVRS